MTFKYIFNGTRHNDCSTEYMQNIGMDREQIESVLAQKDFELGQWAEKRQAAYRAESDPLYIEWQHDQEPGQEQAWRDKVAEIKQRFPKPDA